jgi:hypothetical protein
VRASIHVFCGLTDAKPASMVWDGWMTENNLYGYSHKMSAHCAIKYAHILSPTGYDGYCEGHEQPLLGGT